MEKNDRRVAVAMLVLAALYFLWPIDLMPGVLIDDFVVAAILGIGAYRKAGVNKLSDETSQ